MKKILITGALGHIGSKFIHTIKPGNFEEVRIIDNLSTQRYCSLFNLPSKVKFKFYEDDIRKADLLKLTKDIDVVLHLAAITDAANSFDKKDEVFSVNYEGTRKVSEACLSNGCKMIFPSTTSVYGTQSEIVDENCPETDLKPQSPYAESKILAEKMLTDFGKQGLKFITLRLGTIFGTSVGMRFHTAVNKFCWQAVLGQPITVWRTALNQKRPYLDLSDAIRAFFFIIRKNLFTNEIYNVVTTNSTVGQIIDIIKKDIPDVSINYVDSKIMNQLSYTVSNEKFKKIGFRFRGDIKKGIHETIKILKNVRQLP